MQRVRPVGEAPSVQAPSRASGAQGTRGAFRGRLIEAQIVQANTRLDEQLRAIDQIGEQLGRSLSIGDLKRYKGAIAAFFKDALRMGTQVKTQMEWDSQAWEHRTLVTIEKVNKELDELTELVHAQEQDRLKILAKIGDIKGMLLDIKV